MLCYDYLTHDSCAKYVTVTLLISVSEFRVQTTARMFKTHHQQEQQQQPSLIAVALSGAGYMENV